jgi:pimeloyl-ACP methyl ester carboxylesterase
MSLASMTMSAASAVAAPPAEQVPWGVQALGGKISKAAWKDRPSWFLVAQDDHVIPPDAQRGMAARAGATVRAVSGSHAVFIANPQAVVAVIEEAATSRQKL